MFCCSNWKQKVEPLQQKVRLLLVRRRSDAWPDAGASFSRDADARGGRRRLPGTQLGRRAARHRAARAAGAAAAGAPAAAANVRATASGRWACPLAGRRPSGGTQNEAQVPQRTAQGGGIGRRWRQRQPPPLQGRWAFHGQFVHVHPCSPQLQRSVHYALIICFINWKQKQYSACRHKYFYFSALFFLPIRIKLNLYFQCEIF